MPPEQGIDWFGVVEMRKKGGVVRTPQKGGHPVSEKLALTHVEIHWIWPEDMHHQRPLFSFLHPSSLFRPPTCTLYPAVREQRRLTRVTKFSCLASPFHNSGQPGQSASTAWCQCISTGDYKKAKNGKYDHLFNPPE